MNANVGRADLTEQRIDLIDHEVLVEVASEIASDSGRVRAIAARKRVGTLEIGNAAVASVGADRRVVAFETCALLFESVTSTGVEAPDPRTDSTSGRQRLTPPCRHAADSVRRAAAVPVSCSNMRTVRTGTRAALAGNVLLGL